MLKFLKDESGATAIEYALIASVMVACLVFAMPYVTNALTNKFNAIGSKITAGS